MEQKFRFLMIIALLSVAGFLVPVTSYSITRALPEQLQNPGTPLNDTALSHFVMDNFTGQRLTGDVLIESQKPWILRIDYSNSSYCGVDDAITKAQEFIGSVYLQSLDPVPESQLVFLPNPIWNIKYQGNGTLEGETISIGIDAINQNIVRYHRHHQDSQDFMLLSQEKKSSNSLTQDDAISVVVDFLEDHDFHLTNSMVLLRATSIPNITHISYYKIEIAETSNSVIADPSFQGVTILVDAINGIILDFSYMILDHPEVSLDGIIDPNHIWNQILNDYDSESVWLSTFDYQQAFLRLVLIGNTPENKTFDLQLVWTLQLFNSEQSSDVLEIYRDAYDGSVPGTDYGYIRLGSFTIDSVTASLLVPLVALVLAVSTMVILKRQCR